MRFTVLGKSPAWQDAGGACSSYVAEEGEYRLLVDCGNGAFAKLRARMPYALVDDVLISHIHADHVLDLAPFAYALTLGLPPEPAPPRPRLLLPPGGATKLRTLVSIWGSEGLLDDAFELVEYEHEAELELGPLRASLFEVPHFTLTYAIALEGAEAAGRRLVYGADCRSGPELERAAAGAEVLLAEATLPEPEPDSVPLADRGHMCAAEAAEAAANAGVGRLVLTHMSDQLDGEVAIAAARERFDGPVEIAAEGSHWDL